MARESYRRGVSGENAPGVGSEGRRRTSSFPAHPSIGKSWVGRPMDRQGIRERVNQRTRRSAGAGSARTVRPDRVRCTRSAGGHGRAPSNVTRIFTGAAHGVGTTGTAETAHRTGSHHRHLEDPGHRCAWPPVRSKPDQILSVRITHCLIEGFLSSRVLDTHRCRSRIKSRSNPACARDSRPERYVPGPRTCRIRDTDQLLVESQADDLRDPGGVPAVHPIGRPGWPASSNVTKLYRLD